MKNKWRRVLSAALSAVLVLGSAKLPAHAGYTEFDGEAQLYIGFGGDKAEENDWGYQFNSPDNEGNTEGITAVTETIKPGETKTVSLEFESPVVNTWWMAPVLVAGDGIGEMDCTVSLKIDGADVEIDNEAGDLWWYEGTGDFSDKEAIRLYGGFNEWAAQYIAEPAGFTKVEYTVTFNGAKVSDGSEVQLVDYEGDAAVYVAFGGDRAEENDWGYAYNDPDNAGNSEDIVATTSYIGAGETVTIGLEFPEPVVNVWYMAPVLYLATDIAEVDADITLKIDGEEVAIDKSAGDAWWAEDTGDLTAANGNQPIRLYGGFNEWGAKYIEEPAGFTKVEYTITLNSLKAGIEAEEEAAPAAVELDKSAKYNAYIGFQSPTYSFRNEWAEPSYGANAEGGKYFGQVTGWDADNNAVALPGEFHDAVIDGNGTYTVAATGLDFQFDDWSQDHMNLIFFSTDIPNSDDIQISDVKLKVNGSNVDLGGGGEKTPNGFYRPTLADDGAEYISVQLQNIWNKEIENIGYYGTPVTDIEITFTISGFDHDNTAAVAEETTETTESAPAAEEDTPATGREEPKADEEKGGLSGGAIAGIVACVVAVGGGAAFLATRKKDK
ncbi:MAG: hypothetical protein IKI75_05790 [Lachnospiraceae bacterium]|nr:hypothetical protein [Lachnospiraceae bacterium]